MSNLMDSIKNLDSHYIADFNEHMKAMTVKVCNVLQYNLDPFLHNTWNLSRGWKQSIYGPEINIASNQELQN